MIITSVKVLKKFSINIRNSRFLLAMKNNSRLLMTLQISTKFHFSKKFSFSPAKKSSEKENNSVWCFLNKIKSFDSMTMCLFWWFCLGGIFDYQHQKDQFLAHSVL